MARKKPASKRKYGKKASEKVERAMHEMKRGQLKSGRSGKKVTSRKQAIAIGLAQARRAGGKVPKSPSAHATMQASASIDAKVRARLSQLRAGAEIDAAGMARAIGEDELGTAYALERAARDGIARTDDGKWYGLRDGHAQRRQSSQSAAASWSSGEGSRPRRSHAKMLSSPVILMDTVTLPSGESGVIHIHRGKGGYAGVLVLPNGNELPMSLGAPEPTTATEALRGAKKFLANVYGRTN